VRAHILELGERVLAGLGTESAAASGSRVT
jgi:hypothetical protein